MPNRLAAEPSLYLRQHGENPVDWYPWGPEAFAKAKEEDKPILISIGYSSCHWCHVMAHESFEDDYIAKLMNTHFVCIKVDREERPEVDQIYMDAVQMLNGQGGWPLNVFCLPDGRPFAGGTYFPPDDRRGHNIVPWPQLLMRIADYYERQHSDLEDNAKAIIGNLTASNTPPGQMQKPLGPEDLMGAARQLIENADAAYGGFGTAPKFPPSMNLGFLLSLRGTATIELHHTSMAGEIDAVINRTLTGMAHGGIFDQIGGGFARYSVDQYWQIPHFEKMLYDNALLIDIYARASQRYAKPLFRKVVEESIAWLDREMLSAEEVYFSAIDADTEGEEGTTYLWSPAEVESVLGEADGKTFCDAYGVTPEGNFENTGKTNPALLEADPEERDNLSASREKLLQVRNSRPQPVRDNKRLTSWNALLARGLARAAFSFGNPDWLNRAHKIAEWIWSDMRHGEDRLHAVSYGSEGRENGRLDDYAYAAEAFVALAAVVEWQKPGESSIWKDRATALIRVVQSQFKDTTNSGYFFTSDDHEVLVHRKKDWFDNATPSGNSSLIHVFTALEATSGDLVYTQELQEMKDIYAGITATAPGATSHALSGFVDHAVGIPIIKFVPGSDLEALRQAIISKPWRPMHLIPDSTGHQTKAFQLCVGTRCLAPTDDPGEIAESL